MTQIHLDRPRLLIVDDEKYIRDILADFLGMEGYQVRTAADGAAALNELQQAHYDLIISDLKMPKICLLYTSPSPRDRTRSRMPSSA